VWVGIGILKKRRASGRVARRQDRTSNGGMRGTLNIITDDSKNRGKPIRNYEYRVRWRIGGRKILRALSWVGEVKKSAY